MDASEFWIRFFLATLVTWRVCHFLASEDGPWDVMARLRAWLADSIVGQLIDCFGCTSVWVAMPPAFFVSEGLLKLVMTWLALSAGAFLLERLSPEPVVIERVSDGPKGE
jgi:Protein of unknown function (DUF1360)